MARDPGIICFRHCCARSVFCKSVPEACPICQTCIANYAVEPFVVPYPYTNAAHHPTAIVVRPSQGSFLEEYDPSKELHIGVVNSQGIVVEFDRVGLMLNDHTKWRDCIAVKVVPPSWDGHWDETLDRMLADVKWKSHNYNALTMNCFNFVIEFINNLKYTNMSFMSKREICEKLLLPKIQDAVKYNMLYNNLASNSCFVSN